MKKTGLIVGGVVLFICLCLGLFIAVDFYFANEAKRIGIYDNGSIGIPVLRAALARNPNDVAANMNLGRDYVDYHHYQAAIPELQRVTVLEPQDCIYNSEALFLLATAQKKTGHPDLMLATMRRLATHNDVYGQKAKQYVARHGG